MITAEEARNIAGPSIEKLCEEFDPVIRKAALLKERSISVSHPDLARAYAKKEYLWDQFVEMMQSFGYSVRISLPWKGAPCIYDVYVLKIGW